MKNSITKRLLTLVLAAVMLLSLGLTGCVPADSTHSSDSTTANPSGSTAPEGSVLYTITAKGQGGMLLPNVTVSLTDIQGKEAASGKTDEKGQFSAWLYPAQYTVKITDGLKAGYTAVETKTTEAGGMFDAIANTSVVTDKYPEQPKSYTLGDVMYDFAFVNAEGKEVKLSELLQTKKLIIINFWATWCSPCKREFPAIQEAYEAYGDDVEIIAFSTSDTASKCESFKEENGYTFNMVPDFGLYSRFNGFHGGASIPCTVFVDRYGVINNYMVGGDDDVEAWKHEMEFYCSDNYVQNTDSGYQEPSDEPVVEKPNVQMPESSKIEAAVNGTNSDGTKFNGTYTASEDEYVWPWVVTEDGKAMEPSNYGKDATNAMISMELDFKKGQIFAFDYEFSIDYDQYGSQIYDFLAVYVDGHVMKTLYTKQNGKVTCYAYTPVEAGKHSVTLVYSKDDSTWELMNAGKEFVHVSNLRMISVEDMVAAGESLNVWTPAADVIAGENASTSYENYVDVVMGSDGYYHVGSENGPLLLAKLTGPTQWSSSSLYELGNAGYLKINGVDYFTIIAGDGESNTRNDMWLESHSALIYTPVDERIAGFLDLFASELGEGKNHDKEWLEFCCYFIHYGEGEGVTKVTDVRKGIDILSAFTATEGKNHAFVNQTLVPRGLFYKFVPEKSGVYSFYSIAEGAETSAAGGVIDTEAWILDAKGEMIDESQQGASGHFKMYENMKEGETYYIVVAFASTEDLGRFNFMIDFKGEDDGSFDVMSECAAGYTSDLETGEMIIWRNYGFKAALGTDGYYHQILGYNADGTPILDMGEHGYVYIDFLKSSELISYIPYKDDFCTLKNLIEKGYVVRSESGELVYVPNAFDFTQRTDDEGNSLASLGNHQAEMEAYLKLALSGDKNDFDYGYVKADEKLVEILNCIVALYGEGCRDEWLLAASFAKHP